MNLLRVAKRKGEEGETEGKHGTGYAETTRTVTSRRPSSQQPDLWASSHPSPPPRLFTMHAEEDAHGDGGAEATSVRSWTSSQALFTKNNENVLPPTTHRGACSCVRECVRWNNSYLLERSPKCKCDVSSLQLLCSDLQGRSQALIVLSSTRLKITPVVIFIQ